MADAYFGTLIIVTAVVALASAAFGGADVFNCDDPNDCTGAALSDIGDFDFQDLVDILQVLFIILGDVLELLSFAGIEGIPSMISGFLQIVLGVGWLSWIISVVI